MDELFSILNFNEIERQAAKVAALSRSVTEITLHTPDIPLNDSANTYPHYIFVVTLSLTDAEMDPMISQCPSETDFENMLEDDSLNTMEALSGKLNQMEAGYNNAIPSDIDAVLEIAQGFRKSWTTGDAGMRQNIDRFYKPNCRPTVPIFWDMIVLTSDGGYPQDLRTDPEGMIRVFPDEPAPAKESAPNPQDEPATKEKAENYLQRNGKHWAIKFQDEYNAHIDHVDGLLYIAHILEKQGKDISDQILCQLAKGVPLKETIDTNEMTERNLSKGFRSQSIGTDKERKICQTKYYELECKLETASLEDQEEIKEQMERLLPYLNTKKRNFVDPNNKKAQSNMTRRIDLAYDKLKEENMPELAKYLKDTIKTGYYGRRYVGPVTWKIKFNK